MKIVDTRSEHHTPFGNVGVGTIFMYDHEIYMKINTMQSPAGRSVNAIMLGMGNDVRFGNEELVTPIKCELHIVD